MPIDQDSIPIETALVCGQGWRVEWCTRTFASRFELDVGDSIDALFLPSEREHLRSVLCQQEPSAHLFVSQRSDGAAAPWDKTLWHMAPTCRDAQWVFAPLAWDDQAVRALTSRHVNLLIEHLPVMAYSINDQGQIVSVSDVWLERTGYTRGEVVGRPSLDFLCEESRAYARDVVLPEFFRTGQCRDVHYRYVTRGGEMIDVLLSATSKRDASGRVDQSLAVMVDITERARVQTDLRLQKTLMDAFFEAIPDAVIIASSERVIQRINAHGEALFGFGIEELRGHTTQVLYGDLQTYERRGREQFNPSQTGAPSTAHVRYRRKNGSYFDSETSASPIRTPEGELLGYLGIVRDISERLAMSRREAMLHERTRVVLSSIPDLILEHDTKGHVSFASDTVTEHTKQNKIINTIKDLSDSSIFSQHFDEEIIARAMAASQRATESLRPECFGCTLRHEGARKHCQWTIYPTTYDTLVSVIRDVTGERARIEELARHNEQLAEKNELLEQFVHIAAHDLRSPVRAAKNLRSWLEDDLPEPRDEDIQFYLDEMKRRLEKMDAMLVDLTRFIRESHTLGESCSFPIQEYLSGYPLPEGAEIAYHGPAVLALARIPAEVVLRNLVQNAITHHDRDHIHVTVRAECVAPHCSLMIKDDGPGIDPVYHDKIWKLFQKLDDTHQGSGMGLTIVKHLLSSLGAHIQLESPLSDQGRGTRWIITWPLSS